MRRSPDDGRSGIALIPILIIIALLALVWSARHPILSSQGSWLNNGEDPQKADAILVLAGGAGGERIRKAHELKVAGFAPLVLVSSPGTLYGVPECELSIGLLKRESKNVDGFECAHSQSHSTWEEARAIAPVLRERGIRRLIVLSSDTHMRRAGRIWKSVAPGMAIIMVAAKSPSFQLERWYQSREGQKAVFLEWTKLITSLAGI
jgi:uncharacterized SAM-binding protein YcdF (DUF218 family)